MQDMVLLGQPEVALCYRSFFRVAVLLDTQTERTSNSHIRPESRSTGSRQLDAPRLKAVGHRNSGALYFYI
jgi:hypothetical protein